MYLIIRDIERPSQELIQGFRELETGNICDAMGRYGGMSAAVKPILSHCKIVGPAVTVKIYPADNLMLHKATELAKAGDVLVVDAGGFPDMAILGELLCLVCKKKGIEGIVLDGGVRDVRGIREIGFPVFSKGILPTGPVKDSPGSINVSIQCGGVPVAAGDLIVGDMDGVVVVPRGRMQEVLEKGRAIVEKERKMRERIENGELIYDILGLGKLLQREDVVEVGKKPG
jgi:4-hydroxy-4-methyl-2-oxoglutarate aldolase